MLMFAPQHRERGNRTCSPLKSRLSASPRLTRLRSDPFGTNALDFFHPPSKKNRPCFFWETRSSHFLISHCDATISATRAGDPLLVLATLPGRAGVRRGVPGFPAPRPPIRDGYVREFHLVS